MTVEVAIQQALNGISFGALLFILAAGLSLIFGMMDVINLAHGAFYMLGAYIALAAVQRTGNFWLALVLAPLLVGALGLVIEPLLLRRLRGRHLDQVLLTIGISLVIVDLVGLVAGREIRSIPFPAGLDRSVPIIGGDYPVYRLFVIAFGILLAALFAFIHRRSRLGALIRAGVDDAAMARVVGIRVSRLFTIVFCLGAWLAGFAGVIGGPILSVYPGLDGEMLPLALVVVILGGSGSLLGSLVGSFVVGFLYNFGQAMFPELAYVVLFLPMLIVLVLRPQGLFGRPAV